MRVTSRVTGYFWFSFLSHQGIEMLRPDQKIILGRLTFTRLCHYFCHVCALHVLIGANRWRSGLWLVRDHSLGCYGHWHQLGTWEHWPGAKWWLGLGALFCDTFQFKVYLIVNWVLGSFAMMARPIWPLLCPLGGGRGKEEPSLDIKLKIKWFSFFTIV